MGKALGISCINCAYESKVFYLGIGMMYGDLENLKDRKKVDHWELIEKSNIKLDENFYSEPLRDPYFENSLFYCKDCKIFEEHLYIETKNPEICSKNEDLTYLMIDDNKNKTFMSQYKCRKCKNFLELIHIEEISKINCPKCKKKGLIPQEGVMCD